LNVLLERTHRSNAVDKTISTFEFVYENTKIRKTQNKGIKMGTTCKCIRWRRWYSIFTLWWYKLVDYK